MADYRRLVPHVKAWEGKWSDDPDDPGGATMMGVTMSTYEAYCRKVGRGKPTKGDLRGLSDGEWSRIFKSMYWDRCRADEIDSQSVANMLVDWYWHSGVHAIRGVQRVVGVSIDGVVGRVTIEALNGCDAYELFGELRRAREKYYNGVVNSRPKSRKYLQGWLNRVRALKWVG